MKLQRRKQIVDWVLRHPLLLLVLACTVLGCYCTWLNYCLYQAKAPFYDSMSYHEKMFRVMWLAQNDSLAEALSDAVHGHNTVFLPYLYGIVASFLLEPSRILPIWFQVVELFLFCWATKRYCEHNAALDKRYQLLATTGVFALTCLYFDNGGLSDFRMDLSQMLAYGSTCLSFLAALRNRSWASFVIVAVMASWCLLVRATSPVYLLFACVPILIIELTRTDRRLGILVKSTFAILLTGALTGWYYVANLEYLKFYYLEWNTDANAGLSFWQSLGHLECVKRGMGESFLGLIIVWTLLAVRRVRANARQQGNKFGPWHKIFDWYLFWIGVAPLSLLIGMGAGLNPFVGLLAIPGFAVFSLSACAKLFQQIPRSRGEFWVIGTLCLALLGAAIWGLKNHNDAKFNTMKAQVDILETILEDAKSQDSEEVIFGVTAFSRVNASSLFSILRFDQQDPIHEFEATVVEGVRFWPSRLFDVDGVADWKKLPGDNDDDKLSHLLGQTKNFTHLVVPTARTAAVLTTKTQGTHINKFAVDILDWLVENDQWVQIRGEIQTDRNESVLIFRRLK